MAHRKPARSSVTRRGVADSRAKSVKTGDNTAGPRGELLDVVVTIHESATDRLDEVARKLRKAGMIVDQKLSMLGQCIGHSPKSQLAALRRIAGVEAVEVSGSYQLPDDPSAPQ